MFRAEALQAQKQKLHGDVFLTQPVSFSAITLTLISIVALAVVLLTTGSYARSERVTGYLVPSKGLVKIQAAQFGTLQQLFAHQGARVKTGQVLAEIQLSRNTQDGRSIADKSLEALARQKAVIDTQIVLETNQFEAEQAQLASERAEVELRVVSLNSRMRLQKKITASAESGYTDVQGILEKGFISKVESERRLQSWLSQQAQEEIIEQGLTAAKARLEQLQIRANSLPTESRQRLARLQTQLTEIDSRKVDQEGRQAYTIMSPVDGRVVSLSAVGIGRSVQAGQPLMAILPEGSNLEAELFVPSRAAGFVEAGQEVRLLYDAFPYQRFGSFEAVITQVTETILAPSEVFVPFELNEPVYRVTAALTTDEIMAHDKQITLQSGMTLQANIVLERRSFLDWLLEPLRAVGGRS